MIQSPIPKVLSSFLKNDVKALLIGGQACILYGAAEFSRDIDLAVMISPENLRHLKSALDALMAEKIFLPDLSENALLKGHACHFRCNREDVKGLRVDIISVMRGVDPFEKLWERRVEIELSEIGKIAVIGLADLVNAKKTQRDKDWPMIRRLVEADIFRNSSNPQQDKIYFWLSECRTPELLVSLASKYRAAASHLTASRPLLRPALEGKQNEVEKLIRGEEDKEREIDRQYWKPLKAELECWRLKKSEKD